MELKTFVNLTLKTSLVTIFILAMRIYSSDQEEVLPEKKVKEE